MRRFIDDRGSSAVGMGVSLLVGAALLVGPMMLWSRSQRQAAEGAAAVVEGARDAQADLALSNGVRAAEIHMAETGSYAGFTPAAAARYDAQTTFTTTTTAVPGEVSIRSVSEAGVLLVTTSASGAPRCASVGFDGVRYGRADARSPAECTG